MKLGIAFSGGGSRAAGFHRGTLKALYDLGLLSDEIVKNGNIAVSTVSGGTVFGASWVSSIGDNIGVDDFLSNIEVQLKKGFILRSIRPRLLKMFKSSYSRTNVISETFDKAFFKGKTLKDLPIEPALCINTSVLNNGQVGKFTREGFRATGLTVPKENVPLPKFKLSDAVAASAAFPALLPPMILKAKKHIPKNTIQKEYKDHKRISLSDGGVLENLGLQSLIQGRGSFECWNIIASDAGAPLKPWRPGRINDSLLGILMGFLSAPILKRVSILMNDKENRHMRNLFFEELYITWLISGLNVPSIANSPGLRSYLDANRSIKNRRKLLYIGIDQQWYLFIYGIPDWRLVELGISNVEKPEWYASIEKKNEYIEKIVVLLKQKLPGEKKDFLKEAEGIYKNMGGDPAVEKLKGIKTSFSGLSDDELDGLFYHSYWQVLAAYSIFW